jgi:hypothetical protein
LSLTLAFIRAHVWCVVVDMLELAEQRRKRDGVYPTLAQLVCWMMALGFRWGGGNLFFCDFDATESLFHEEIIESMSLKAKAV